MKKQIIKNFVGGAVVSFILLNPQLSIAQGAGSTTTIATANSITGTRTTTSQILFIDAGADITIASGAVWNIYSKYVYIDPRAKISGPGTINIYNSSDVSGTGGATIIDGNSDLLTSGGLASDATASNYNYITAPININNTSGIQLANLESTLGLSTTMTAQGIDTTTSSIRVNATITFAVDNGNIWLGGVNSTDKSNNRKGNLYLGVNGTFANYSSARMVVTNNSTLSHLIKNQSTNTSFVYPFGIAATDYTPATIAGSNTYALSVIDYTQGGTNPIITVGDKGMKRTWHLYGTGTGSSIILQHNSTTDGSLYTADISNSFITQYAGSGSWTYPGSSNLTSNSGGIEVHTNTPFAATIPTTGTSNLSYLTKSVDKNYPLPVTYLYFNAEKEGTTSLLTWATGTEINSKGFYVLRSVDGANWSELGFVNSKAEGGTSNSELDYSYVDTKPVSGLNYYKLRQVDLDNNTSESIIKTVRFDLGSEISIYPNPAYSEINVRNVESGSSIKILTIDGKEVQTHVANNNIETLNVNGLASGMYIIQVIKGNQLLKNVKFTKQ